MGSGIQFSSPCATWWRAQSSATLPFHGSKWCQCRRCGQGYNLWRYHLWGSFSACLWWEETSPSATSRCRSTRPSAPPPRFSRRCLLIWWPLRERVGSHTWVLSLLLLVLWLLVGYVSLISLLWCMLLVCVMYVMYCASYKMLWRIWGGEYNSSYFLISCKKGRPVH